MDNETYSVTLTVQQWDLVVLALGYVQERAAPHTSITNAIDIFSRRMLRRRLNEVLMEIQGTVPDAGSGDLDP